MRIGFIGAGVMGAPVARHLIAAGHDLTLLVRRADAAPDVAAAGGRVTTAPADLAGAELLVLCLPDGPAVEAVLFGPAPVPVAAGAVVVDLTTHDRATARALADRLARGGAAYADAPISGMAARAEAGTLTVMCGAAPEAFDRIAPLFHCFAETVLHMGGVGAGQLAKLVNQLPFDVNAAALAELLPAAARLGLDPRQVAAVVNGGTGRSYASEFFLPRILEGRFSDGYPLAKAYKDLQAGAALSADLAQPLPVLAAATATYQTALREGHGALDKGAMILPFERLAGVRFRARPRVFCTLALRGVVEALRGGLPEPLDIDYAPTKIALARIAAGERPALALLTDEAARGLEAAGEVAARRPLVVSRIGVAGPAGAPPPAFATMDDLVAFLREAPSICYSATGASGLHFAALLDRLGLRETIDARAVVLAQGLTGAEVLAGRAACAVQQISELAQVPGLSPASPLPEAAQRADVFSAVLFSADPAGEALLAALDSPAARALMADQGLAPIDRIPA